MTDLQPTDQPTDLQKDMNGHREVRLSIIQSTMQLKEFIFLTAFQKNNFPSKRSYNNIEKMVYIHFYIHSYQIFLKSAVEEMLKIASRKSANLSILRKQHLKCTFYINTIIA